MKNHSNGWLNGFIGVLIFSGSLPATRLAVQDFNPFFTTSARNIIAGILACCLLLVLRQKIPNKQQLISLVHVAIALVLGFPLLTALALEHISASQSIIFIGILPFMTAFFGAIQTKQYPPKVFWIFSVIGACLVGYFAFDGNFETSFIGNLYMVFAVVICGYGYAKSAILTKALGGWQVMSWALLIASPVMISLALYNLPNSFTNIHYSAWLGLFYVGIFSSLIGFLFWNKGLSQGGITAISQLQLLQPFLGLCFAALLLGEVITLKMVIIATLVTCCIIASKYFMRKL